MRLNSIPRHIGRRGAAKAKPKAKPKARSTRSRIDQERRACKNTVHYVLRCKEDDHFVHAARQLVAATAAECAAEGAFIRDVKSPDEVTKFWAERAAGKWVKTLSRSLASLSDPVLLGRCGFLTSPADAEEVTLECPTVYMQDAMSQRFQALVYSVMRHRASSLEWHTSPGYLIGNVGLLNKGLTRFA